MTASPEKVVDAKPLWVEAQPQFETFTICSSKSRLGGTLPWRYVSIGT
jgi:hypothetical protein